MLVQSKICRSGPAGPAISTPGIPQGSILGPILFTVFINDLPDCVHSVCKIFADDTKVYDSCTNQARLQDDLHSLHDWSNKWQLHFNASKCKCLHYGRGNPITKYTITPMDASATIQDCTEEKDLGVIFDDTLKFDIHITTAINKANMMIGLIRRNFSFIDKDTFNKLYKALVRPHLEYAHCIWYPQFKRQSVAIENVQRRATKLVQNISRWPYESRLRMLNLPSLKYRRLRGDMIQVFKILNDKDDIKSEHFFSEPMVQYTRGHDHKLYVAACKTISRKYSFSHRVVQVWNSLPNIVVCAKDTNQFKKLLDGTLEKQIYEFD